MCALILGAVELGRIAYGSIEVANAAHAAAAYAAQNPTTPYSPYLQTIAADDAADLKAVSTVSTPSCICSSGTNNCSACAVGAHRQDFVTVTVSGNMKTLFGVPGIPSTLTLSSTAVMRMQEEN
jgi:Flp pilus assembly protein TadG